MGLIISRFRKKKSTKDQLELIEKEIKYIHEFRVHTQQRQRRFVGSLIAYSVVFYICAFVIFYFYYFPDELIQQMLYSLPLLLFPLLIWGLKELLHWFFQNKLRKNDTKLTELLNKKRKLLDEVMETETYKVARELLEKFDPDQLRKKSAPGKEDVLAHIGEPDVRQRNVGMVPGKSSPAWKSPPLAVARRNQSPPGAFFQGGSAPTPFIQSSPQTIQKLRPPGPPMPRPVLPRDRTFIDRLIEYLIGDGPTTRYALICRQCQSHNGMALKEEFEYMAFRCCYCYYWNPARRQRPAAPRLPEVQYSSISSVDSATKPEKEGDEEKEESNHTSDDGETGSEFSIASNEEENEKEVETLGNIEEPVSTEGMTTVVEESPEKIPTPSESTEVVESPPPPTSAEADSA